MCSLARQDYIAARGVFSRMSKSAKNEPVTRYLMYKAALQSDDVEFCRTSLQVTAIVSLQSQA
jgi:hypothetical protein